MCIRRIFPRANDALGAAPAGPEAAGLKPAGPADKRALIRRAYFDLIGLPPTPAQVEAFVKDNSPKAFEKVVDELLAAPQFGERWARHWLDLMRYAETFGHEFDFMNQEVWRYRDYVIRAFNDDVPYDRFVKEHIKYFDNIFYGLKLNAVLEQEYGIAVQNFRQRNRIPCMTVIPSPLQRPLAVVTGSNLC